MIPLCKASTSFTWPHQKWIKFKELAYYGLEMVWLSTLYSRLMTYVCGLVMGDGYNFNVHGLGSTINTASNDGQTGIWMCPNMRDWRIYPQKYGNCWEGKWWSTIYSTRFLRQNDRDVMSSWYFQIFLTTLPANPGRSPRWRWSSCLGNDP